MNAMESTHGRGNGQCTGPLVGSPAAERLLRTVVENPLAPLVVLISGPGGCGKSALLTAVDDAYRAAGVKTTSTSNGPVEVDNGPMAVLVDDAQDLGPVDIERLADLVGNDAVRLVIAHRPWPRSAELTGLVAAIRAITPRVVLEHFDATQIETRARALLGGPVPANLLEVLTESTGGLPVLVDRIVTSLRDNGALETHDPLTVPREIVDRLHNDLAALDDGAQALMLAIAVGAPLDRDLLGPLLELDSEVVGDHIGRVHASGLLLKDGTLVPLARRAILDHASSEQVRTIQRAVLDAQLARQAPVIDIARRIIGTGVRDTRAASVLANAGDQARYDDPALAVLLYDEAIAAGAQASHLAARHAEAAALTGDLSRAIQLADRAMNDPDVPDLARGVNVAATVLAHRGLLARSAELYRWLGPARIGAAAPLAALSFIGTGSIDEAQQILSGAQADRTPTLLAGAESLMAQGVQESLTGSPTTALSTLTRAATLLEPAGRTILLPDTPAALAALVALHFGELDQAASVLTRARATDLGGPPARPRHLLLLAWTSMLRGQLELARRHMTEAMLCSETLEPRDELFVRGLQVGLAWRSADLIGLSDAWERAREAIVRHPVDLFVLLPLGELLIAAGRLKDSERMAPHLEEAQQLLASLDDPVLWGTPLHWAGVHAAIYAERPADLEPHAAALVKAAKTSHYARILATAGSAWLQVLRRDIDVPTVESAARALQSVGLAWDGCRLAGQAAVRAKDARARIALLQCARSLQTEDSQPPAESPETPASLPTGTTPAVRSQDRMLTTALSGREREVAELIIAGQTYREIGAKLYISAKTVEHHVARIRRRLGAQNRSELFTHLRALLETDPRHVG